MNTVTVSERFETSSVTLYLEWSTKNGVSYTVDVYPTTFVNYTGKDSAQLTVSYNIIYNVSVATSLCGKNSTTFNVQKYGKVAIIYLVSVCMHVYVDISI